MKRPSPKNLYYITHVNNVPSILEYGILSHASVERQNVSYTSIYDSQIVSNRRDKKAPNGQSLWEFANLYFQPRNPMLYRVIHEKGKDDIAVIAVLPSILNQEDAFVTTGNAASLPSEILPAKQGIEAVNAMWSIIDSEWWREEDGSKRKIMAECLVPNSIPSFMIDCVYVAKHSVAEKLRRLLGQSNRKIEVVPEPNMFFQPTINQRVTDRLTLAQGDMFFSNMQTLTISVNTVGVMGKGLASRAKYQFPDVYVIYQDACKNKLIQPGVPYLYKREAPLDSQLADETAPLTVTNSKKWFLLFPTKRHWKEDSRIEDIEAGLQWLSEHYQNEGISSLAVPALGCGLGGLDWREVGPLMCRYLTKFSIDVVIYLPREQEIPKEFLTADFLLR